MKNKFIALLDKVQRPGMDQLKNYLLNGSDFFTAPASTKYHGAKEGGLVEHSIAVFENLQFVLSFRKTLMETNPETAALIALLHDICKANFYKVDTKNVKVNGAWEQQPYYTIEDKFPYGHGEKSVFILREFISLSVEEAMAIRWHMGAWGAESYADKQTLSTAMEQYPLILALQMADQAASYFDKK